MFDSTLAYFVVIAYGQCWKWDLWNGCYWRVKWNQNWTSFPLINNLKIWQRHWEFIILNLSQKHCGLRSRSHKLHILTRGLWSTNFNFCQTGKKRPKSCQRSLWTIPYVKLVSKYIELEFCHRVVDKGIFSHISNMNFQF